MNETGSRRIDDVPRSPAGEPMITTGEPVQAREAASVLIVRDGDDGRLEVLLMQRHLEARFMAGAWVFPGGGVDPDDHHSDDDVRHRGCAIREVAEETGIDLGDPDALIAYSRWITPEVVAKRFDTRFYIGMAPPNATAVPDGDEMTEARWLNPADALAAGERGEMLLVFPTIKQLEPLVPFGNVREALDAIAGWTVEPVLPKVVGEGANVRVALPGDPDY